MAVQPGHDQYEPGQGLARAGGSPGGRATGLGERRGQTQMVILGYTGLWLHHSIS